MHGEPFMHGLRMPHQGFHAGPVYAHGNFGPMHPAARADFARHVRQRQQDVVDKAKTIVEPCVPDGVLDQVEGSLVGKTVCMRVSCTWYKGHVVGATPRTRPSCAGALNSTTLLARLNYAVNFPGLPEGAKTIEFTHSHVIDMHDNWLANRKLEVNAREKALAERPLSSAQHVDARAPARAELTREISRTNRLSDEWWKKYGKNIFPEYLEGGADSKNGPGGLTQYEFFTIALIKMRRGKRNMELAGDVGVARGNFGTAVDAWIFKLGAFAKHTLIGIPDMEYILQSMPESFMECGMGGVVAVGDATDILCETVRVAYMQQV
ncbi:hypothetical protein T492DRAFT_1133770 [Pavlovales sp. CCMP2436]|nr:hypothetical protein T492DRAFT_1133770 [Pavlovales sp. CCMP2436]